MNYSAIEKILETATGLDSNSIGSNVVHRVIKLRMKMAGATDIETYHAKLKGDKSELQALIEEVTVPETWFFRDKAPFELLSHLVRNEWTPPSKERTLRILSVPCATGEEAYSIAMVLRDLEFDSESVHIDAVDISKRALARASEAVYGENSFRGDEKSYMRRFFDKSGNKYKINEDIRCMVKFWYGNLLDDKFLASAELYDIIFCRNVMIYFTKELQQKAIKKLHRLLAIDGLLFVGHAETANLSGELFSSVKHSGAFAFRKKLAGTSRNLQVSQPPQKMAVNAGSAAAVNNETSRSGNTAKPKGARRASKKALLQIHAGNGLSSGVAKDANHESIMEQIRRMADEGNLKEASALCEEYLENDSVNADAYFWLGLIREAEARDVDAGNLFRKAVYLNPRHYEALVHLAVLAETQGNLAAAAVYRARASRLSKED